MSLKRFQAHTHSIFVDFIKRQISKNLLENGRTTFSNNLHYTEIRTEDPLFCEGLGGWDVHVCAYPTDTRSYGLKFKNVILSVYLVYNISMLIQNCGPVHKLRRL